MNCEQARHLVSDYIDGAVASRAAASLERHLKSCPQCRALMIGARNVVQLVRDPRAFPLPAGFSERLQERLAAGVRTTSVGEVRLGIGDAVARRGDHIAYFRETERDFEVGVGFLEVGLRSGDACFVFGHEQANSRILEVLRASGCEVERLIRARRLYVLDGSPSGQTMLANISVAFQAAMAAGAGTLRLLGNLGWGKPGWPADDGMLDFEARVTEAARQFPCVVVCMYDVHSVSGRVLLKGGFETHPHTLNNLKVRENHHYVPADRFLADLERRPGSTLVH
ncbi:MAG: MEDS domain-containing protein [Acidobacteria bacterium]|nr:MEDS domain-containing protein [Acidobacteriota bacterium]